VAVDALGGGGGGEAPVDERERAGVLRSLPCAVEGSHCAGCEAALR
jgi:hypothetical protein